MTKTAPIKKKRSTPKTFLEIGAGEKAAVHLMPKIKPGDKYVAVDSRPRTPPYIAHIAKKGVKNLFTRGDAFDLPLRDQTVDYAVSRNVISDPAFPYLYAPNKFRDLNFRQALEKLEAELHRVTKSGAPITFHEHYTPNKLDEPLENDGKSRRKHLQEVFSRRWVIGKGDLSI